MNFAWDPAPAVDLQSSSTAAQLTNPALACGMNEVWNFDVFSFRYANLVKQHGRLSMGRIFNSKRNLKIDLKDRFLQPADVPAGYSTLIEKLAGTSTITLKRLRR